MKKKITIRAAIIMMYVIATATINSAVAQALNSWTQKANLAVGRDEAVSFTIGNKAYIGTGYQSGSANLKDFWEYNQATDTWTQKADFAGSGRYLGSGFSIGNKGYIVCGIHLPSYTFSNDLWEYDPSTDVWTEK